jgi:ankyrin repeat protein
VDFSARLATTTALIAAASKGHLAVMEQLLAAGAKSELPSAAGVTPLFLAAAEDRASVAKIILA